ncbi:MAG: endonuclease III [Bacteroidales bacterium]|nr:endonuclease III [Bacteroidales bacterium]
MKKAERYAIAFEQLKGLFPDAQTELNYDTPFQLLVAVILSAQCTDKRVNLVTPELFKRFPTAKQMSESSEEEILRYIKSISYPNAKSKNLLKMSQRLESVYNGILPETREELTTLAGVGRKTANVICAVLYNQSVMPVDTHVHRVSRRIGLTDKAKTPLDTEKQLMSNLKNESDIALLHHRLILLGRYICKARKPGCEECTLKECCKFYHTKHQSDKAKNSI